MTADDAHLEDAGSADQISIKISRLLHAILSLETCDCKEVIDGNFNEKHYRLLARYLLTFYRR